MIKIIIFAFLYILGLGFLNAQTITLKGSVKDSLQNPLAYSNVIVKPKDLSKNLKFAITDNEGLYRLKLTKGDTYTISISYLGYNSINVEFIANKTTTKNFVLQESENQLDEVIIEMPVIVKGDTTTYNTGKFVTGTERKLKDVLKKLPGVEVKKGKVTVQGKKVTTMLVDGKKFFGGSTKLAVENIPADAVDKVQAIDNYNEVSFLKGISDTDDMAMNIILKEDKKNFMFGDIEAGKGNKKFYRTHANLFYYSPKTNVNFIGNINNTGEKTFTFDDYLSFQGGINAIFKGTFKWRGGDLYQFLQDKDLLSSSNKFVAVNITKTTTSKLEVSGYAIFSHSKTNSFRENTNQYTTITEQKKNKTDAKNIFGIGKFNLEYTPSKLEKWYIRTQIKKTNNTRNNQILSQINLENNTIFTNRDTDAFYINQNIEWHKKQSKNHTFSFIADYRFDKNNPTAFWNTRKPVLQGLIPVITPQNNYKLQQFKEIKRHNFNMTFKHFWVLNNDNHIYTTIGNEFKNDQFYTDDSQKLDDNTTNNFSNNDFGNDVNYKLNDLFFGAHYKFRTGILTFKQGAYLHNYNWKINQQKNTDRNKWIVLPDFLAKIEFNKSKKIQFNYNLKSSFTGVSKLADRFYLRSYNSVFKGNKNLENELYHNARIRYTQFSMFRGLQMVGSINYTKKIRGITNIVEFDNSNPESSQRANQFLTVKMIDNPSENWVFTGFIHKKIKIIKYKLGVDANLSKYLQNIGSKTQTNKNNNYSVEIGAETFFKDFPTVEIGYKRTIGNYISSNSTSKFTTNEPFINIDYNFLKGFIFSFDYTRYDYQNKSQSLKNVYELANATLSYKNEDSAWSYKLTVQNLFDTTFKQSNSFSNYLISDTKTYILPRVIMFSIGYNL